MSAQYYILKNGQPTGPYTWAQVVLQRPGPETMIWREGLDGWTPITTLSAEEEQTLRPTPSARQGRRMLRIFVACVISFIVVGFFTLLLLLRAGTGYATDWLITRIPTKIDTEMGVAAREDFLKHHPLDTARSRSLQLFYNELGYSSDTRIYVVNDSVFNAFAFPDNSIVVLGGALDHIGSSKALAALLAHEYTHIARRHAMRQLAREVSVKLAMSILLGRGARDVLMQHASNLLYLAGSRDMELEADTKGMELMLQHNISPEGMIELLTEIAKLSDGASQHIPDMVSTHPATKERLQKARSFAETHKGAYSNGRLEQLYQDVTAW